MARIKDQISPSNTNWKRLEEATIKNRLHSTFLFAGQDEALKKKIIFSLAQMILCENKSKAPCGLCGPCLRIEKEASESLLWIRPDKTSIKVEQAAEILNFLSLQAVSAARFIIIEDAEKMTSGAANSLLKILEEPPASTYFFLLIPSASSVLATIKSRSQVFFFDQREESDLDPEFLKSVGELLFKIKTEEPNYYLSEDYKSYFADRVSSLKSSLYFQRCLHGAFMGKNALSEWSPEELAFVAHQALKLEQGLTQNRDLQLLAEEFWIHSRNKVKGSSYAKMD